MHSREKAKRTANAISTIMENLSIPQSKIDEANSKMKYGLSQLFLLELIAEYSKPKSQPSWVEEEWEELSAKDEEYLSELTVDEVLDLVRKGMFKIQPILKWERENKKRKTMIKLLEQVIEFK